MTRTRDDEQRDADPRDGRDETETERLDRNWNGLLQELRVLETGTQILTGFLLTVAFQSAFHKLDAVEVTIYLITVSFAVLAAILVLTPVALHRGLFRQRKMAELVTWTDRILRISLLVAGLAVIGVASLVFHVAAGTGAGIAAGVVAALVLVSAWFLLPFGLRRHD